MSCACFVCGLISMLLTLYIGRIKNVLAAVKITCGSLFFLCSVIFFFGRLLSLLEAHMRNDLDYNGSDGKDPFFPIVFFRSWASVWTSLFVFVLNYCFILLIKLSFFFFAIFQKATLSTFCHWVNAMSCNRNPLLRKIGLRYSTLL